jgi:KDO2-lipid IV(A) lauroyltransferase
MTDSTTGAASLAHPRYWPLWLAIAITWLVAQLPWRILQGLGRALGHILWRLARSRRETARTNIRLCFPELSTAEQEALAREAVIQMGVAITELAGSYCNRWVRFDKRIEIEGWEHLEAARRNGGVLLLGVHFNTLEVAGRLLATRAPYSAVFRPNDNPLLDAFIRYGRSRYTEKYIDRQDIRALVRQLRDGRIVWYAPDQDYGVRHAVFAPFFGHPAATITATSRLAKMGRATVVPMGYYRLSGGRYKLVFLPPLQDFPGDDDIADATRVNSTVETLVRRAPAQYLWVHRRFKHQPEGCRSPYRK